MGNTCSVLEDRGSRTADAAPAAVAFTVEDPCDGALLRLPREGLRPERRHTHGARRRAAGATPSRPRSEEAGRQSLAYVTDARRANSCSSANRRTGVSDRLRHRRTRTLVGIVAAAMAVALALPWGGAGGHPLATSGPARAGASVAPHELYVVQPGDTLWGLASRLDPGGDPRAVEAQLEAEIGGDDLYPGERLVLP